MNMLPLLTDPKPGRAPARTSRASRGSAQLEAEFRNEQKQLRQWRRWRKEKVQALLNGPHGREISDLVAFLNRMRLSSAPTLIELIEQAAWIRSLSASDRFDLLQVISTSITRLRLRNGLPPFDDALPGHEPKACEQIKELMGVR